MTTAVSGRKILVTPDLKTAAFIEHAIFEVAASRGTRHFGRGNLLSATARALAEVGFSFAGCKTEAHCTSRLVDVLLKGLAAEGSK
jgi:hypothetical protein